jgi:hypothetical protein
LDPVIICLLFNTQILGLHFLTLRYKNAPNISFFLLFEYNDVYCLKWNQQKEDLEDEFMRQVRLWFEDFSIAFFFRTVTMEMSGKC